MLLQESRRTHVRRQHAFFDQFMRIVAHHRHDALDLALIGEDHLRFNRLEVNCAAFLSRLQQLLEQLVKVLQMRHDGGIARSQSAIRLCQHFRNLVVSQARLGMHHRRVETVFHDIALGADLHVAHHAQAINLWIERTQAVGQLLRQHRNHPAREIH